MAWEHWCALARSKWKCGMHLSVAYFIFDGIAGNRICEFVKLVTEVWLRVEIWMLKTQIRCASGLVLYALSLAGNGKYSQQTESSDSTRNNYSSAAPPPIWLCWGETSSDSIYHFALPALVYKFLEITENDTNTVIKYKWQTDSDSTLHRTRIRSADRECPRIPRPTYLFKHLLSTYSPSVKRKTKCKGYVKGEWGNAQMEYERNALDLFISKLTHRRRPLPKTRDGWTFEINSSSFFSGENAMTSARADSHDPLRYDWHAVGRILSGCGRHMNIEKCFIQIELQY